MSEISKDVAAASAAVKADLARAEAAASAEATSLLAKAKAALAHAWPYLLAGFAVGVIVAHLV